MQKKNCHRKENNSKFHYNLLQIFEGHLSRMVSKFLIIFIAAFAIFHYFSYFVSCSTSRNIALIIYFEDSKTINTSLISRNLSLSSGNGGTLKTNFYSLKRIGDSYQEIVNSTLIEIVQNNDFVISFLKGIESNILNEVLKDYKVKHFALSPEDCHLVSFFHHCHVMRFYMVKPGGNIPIPLNEICRSTEYPFAVKIMRQGVLFWQISYW